MGIKDVSRRIAIGIASAGLSSCMLGCDPPPGPAECRSDGTDLAVTGALSGNTLTVGLSFSPRFGFGGFRGVEFRALDVVGADRVRLSSVTLGATATLVFATLPENSPGPGPGDAGADLGLRDAGALEAGARDAGALDGALADGAPRDAATVSDGSARPDSASSGRDGALDAAIPDAGTDGAGASDAGPDDDGAVVDAGDDAAPGDDLALPADLATARRDFATPRSCELVGSFTIRATLVGDIANGSCDVTRTFRFRACQDGTVTIAERLPLRVRQEARILVLGGVPPRPSHGAAAVEDSHAATAGTGIVRLAARTAFEGPRRVEWVVSGGSFTAEGEHMAWHLPEEPGLHHVQLLIDFGDGGFAHDTMSFEVA